MKLECPVCFNLLSEGPDLKIKPEPEDEDNRHPVKKGRYNDDVDSSPSSQHSQIAELAVTKCGHLFHKCCVLDWFATNLSCPTCRIPAPDGAEELRNVFLPTPDDNDSQILFKSTTEELEMTKSELESLAEENASLKVKIEELTNATIVKDRCSRKLQNDKYMMESCTDKLRDRHKRVWDQLTELRKKYALLETRADGLENEVTQLKRTRSSQGGTSRGRGGRGRRGRRRSQRVPSDSSSSNNSGVELIDLTDD